MSLTELTARLHARALSPVEIVCAFLERVERYDHALRAFITVDADGALEAARIAEKAIAKGGARTPLHGIPVAVKDLFWTRGLRTTGASVVLADFLPSEDAAAVGRMRDAGAIIIGKTNLPELGYSPCDQYHDEYGVPRNPWDLNRFPGASSSGSAVAVATQMVPLSIGSDTGGSIRAPAAFCGVSGFKPTFGLVSRFGMIPLAPSLDHVGLLGRTAEDCTLLFNVLVGYDARDAYSSYGSESHRITLPFDGDVRGWRIGLFFDHVAEEAQPAVRAAVATAAETFALLGAETEEITLPGFDGAVSEAVAVLAIEAAHVHAELLEKHAEELVPDVRRKLEEGRALYGGDYVRAQEARQRVRATLEAALRRVDLLIGPTCDTVAPRMASEGRILDPPRFLIENRPSNRIPFNLAGIPAASVPCGADEAGLPIGLHVAGRAGEDWRVLAACDAFQAVTSWHARTPPLVALDGEAVDPRGHDT